ncbi:MAG: hypothetical protein OXC13_18150 [Caldilineaceae bacterium]|nr:hypothetical protein [Caldilineaceae bacterium]
MDETWLPTGGNHRLVGVVLGPKGEQLDLRLAGPGFDGKGWFKHLETRGARG